MRIACKMSRESNVSIIYFACRNNIIKKKRQESLHFNNINKLSALSSLFFMNYGNE